MLYGLNGYVAFLGGNHIGRRPLRHGWYIKKRQQDKEET
jgi:hypothetical protein